MEDGLLTALEALGILLMAVLPALIGYRWLLSRQRLPYGQGMARRLIRWGALISLVASLLVQGIRLLGFGSLLSPLQGYAQPVFSLVSLLIETGFKLLALYMLVLRPRHYVNRFDLMIYAISLGLGDGIMRAVALALTGDMASSLSMSLPLVSLQLVYQALMGWCLMRYADKGEATWLPLAWLLPSLAQFAHDALGAWRGPGQSALQWALAIGMIALAGWGLNRAALHNLAYPGQDARAIIDKEAQRHSLRQRLAYAFDNLMARGNLGPIGFLVAFCLLAALGLALIVYFKAPAQVNGKISQAIWAVSMRMLDSGNLAPDLATGNPHFVVVNVLATLLGLISLSSLIGLISSILDQKLDRLRSGHSRILERGHVLLLGMSDEALRLVEHLVQAKKSRRRLPVVIIDDLPKETLDAAVSINPLARHGVHLIVRRGDIRALHVLSRVNLTRARHIVISGAEDTALSCAAAVRQMLKNSPQQTPIPVSLMLGELSPRLAAARYFPANFQVYYAHQLAFNPLARAMRDKHFIAVYSSLTRGQASHSLAASPWRQAQGMDLYEAAPRLRYSSALGLLREGQVLLAPPQGSKLAVGDQVILVKNHRDPLHLAAAIPSGQPPLLKDQPFAAPPGICSLLIIGNLGLEPLLEQLDIPPDSGITLHLLPGYEAARIEEKLTNNPYDLVICLGEAGIPAKDMDAYLNPFLLLIRALCQGQDAYLCAALQGSRSVQYAYETDLVDLVLEDGRSRLIAANILRDEAPVPALESALFYGEKGLALLSAQCLDTREAIALSALTKALAERGILLMGYMKQLEGSWQVSINPNKNEQVAFNPEDLLVVVKA